MAVRMKFVVAYLGTPFRGWQRQRNLPTVQGELERALSSVVDGAKVTVIGAGRTDSGVHAAGQTAHCDLPVDIPPEGLTRGLNNVLPPTIRVRSARSVGPAFHAIKSARGKLYIYRLRWQGPKYPWLEMRTARFEAIPNIEAIAEALAILPGTRDWASFTVTEPSTLTTVRTLYQARLIKHRNGIDFEFLGSGFVRFQVRRMVGALLEVGRSRRSLEELGALLSHPQPGASIQTAPAHGLSLEKVFYRRTRGLTLPTEPQS